MQGLVGQVCAVLLDTKVKGQRGGTGVTFDWAVAGALAREGIPCIVAGGLTVDNVRDAVGQVRP